MGRMAWRGAAVGLGLLAVGVIVAPTGIDAWMRLTLLVAVAACMVTGTLYWRQTAVTPWWLLVGSVSAFAVASLLRIQLPDPEASLHLLTDGMVLLGYVLLAAAGLGLVRRIGGRADREGLLDAAIVAVALAAVLTVLLFQPRLLGVGAPSRVHLFAGPTVFAALAGIITRFALAMPRACPSALLLVAATAGGLAGNLLRTADVALGGGFRTGSVADGLLLAAYVGLAVAALHPSMTQVASSVVPAPERLRTRLLLLGGALLVPPVILAFEPPQPGRWISVGAAATVSALAVWRLAGLLIERERSNAELHAQSRRDALTGLANRRLLDELLTAALARASRSGTPVGVLFCDLDGFKSVNDRFGHATGDDALVEVARRLKATVRTGDVLARLAGDEFVVMVEDLDEPAARRLAARVVAAVSAPITAHGEPVVLGVSVGFACATTGSAADLLAAADQAMYQDKRRRGARSSDVGRDPLRQRGR